MGIDCSRVQAICFDVDGTLSDTDDLWVQRLSKLLHPIRFVFPNKDGLPFARWVVISLETPGNLVYSIADRLNLDDEAARLFNAIARRRGGHKVKYFLLIPQVSEMLHKIAQRYPISVVSARDQESTLAFLVQFELDHLFQSVATSQTCQYTKPFPHPILWAAQQMNVAPENCLMVGDTPVDIKAGKAAGAQTVGVLCGFGTEAELIKAGADLILSTTADLVQILSL